MFDHVANDLKHKIEELLLNFHGYVDWCCMLNGILFLNPDVVAVAVVVFVAVQCKID